jgi:hypothetical protein
MLILKKSQNAIEFMIIIFMILIAFVGFILILNNRALEINEQQKYESLMGIGKIIKSEIDLAIKVEEGYHRTFKLPELIGGREYNVTYTNGTSLNINYSVFMINYTQQDTKNSGYMFITEPNITGTIKIGLNNITKNNKQIVFN